MEEIKAVDIMVGNLIYRKYWNPDPDNERYSYSVEKVIGIYKDTIYCTPICSKHLLFKIKDAYSIPLTEDVLLKAEAKPYTAKDTFILGNIIIDIKLGIVMLDCIDHTSLLCKCKYLHTFQNIVKLLTGNDLKIEA